MNHTDFLHERLRSLFGFESFRPAQEEIVNALLAGHDTLAILPTGGGKSLCYQLPALCRRGLTVVISPLIALMKDQVDALREQNLPATFLNSTLDSEAYMERVRALNSGAMRLLYLAPERLTAPGFRQYLQRLPVEMFIVDEAHCISEWGHDFRPSYRDLAGVIAELPQRPVVGAFTATATPVVMDDIRHYLQLQNEKTFLTSFDRPNLYFDVVRPQNKMLYLRHFLKEHQGESGIIYCSTRRDVEEVHRQLVRWGYQAGRYHAGLSETERNRMQEQFRCDRLAVIVATNAFGMGIDKPDVRFVVHYQLPKSIEAYYQEAGRAGRDGLPATCVLIYDFNDIKIQQFLLEQSGDTGQGEENLAAMQAYACTDKCLRRTILAHFGDKSGEDCGHCRNCDLPPLKEDRTEDARGILQAVAGVRERFGISTISRLLRGKLNARDRSYYFHTLPQFASRHDATDKEITAEIKQLIEDGYLAQTSGRYPQLALTAAGKTVIRGAAKVELRVPQQAMPKLHNTAANAPQNDSLFQQLRAERSRLAAAKNVPPYIIFSDKTLTEMCTLQPHNLEEMRGITGIGDYKLSVYGPAFLAIINQWREENE